MDIRYLKGVGEKRAAQLARLGIRTVDDLLGFYPRNYVDYSHPYPVAGAPYDVKCVVRATVYGKTAARASAAAARWQRQRPEMIQPV